MNDRLSAVSDIRNFILAERAARDPELEKVLTTSLKIDKDAKMGLVGEIKQELRKMDALKINYTTTKGSVLD